MFLFYQTVHVFIFLEISLSLLDVVSVGGQDAFEKAMKWVKLAKFVEQKPKQLYVKRFVNFHWRNPSIH